MKIFYGFSGIKTREGNILVEMCSGEFFLKHAPRRTVYEAGSEGWIWSSSPLQQSDDTGIYAPLEFVNL